MAERYSNGRTDWIETRWRLIDEVLAYRRDGVLTQALLDACEAEFAVASWAYSEGIRRLVELTRDGHQAPRDRLDVLLQSKDWRIRYEVILTSFDHVADRGQQLDLLARALADRSGRIRGRLAGDAVHAHLTEAIPLIEDAAAAEAEDKAAQGLFRAAYYLKRNARTGTPGVYGGGERDDAEQFDADWMRFQAERRR